MKNFSFKKNDRLFMPQVLNQEQLKKVLGGTGSGSNPTWVANCPGKGTVTCYGNSSGGGCSATDNKGCTGTDSLGSKYTQNC